MEKKTSVRCKGQWSSVEASEERQAFGRWGRISTGTGVEGFPERWGQLIACGRRRWCEAKPERALDMGCMAEARLWLWTFLS